MNKYIITSLIALGIAFAIPQAASAAYTTPWFGSNAYTNSYNNYGYNGYNNCNCGYNTGYNTGYNANYNRGYAYNPYANYSYWAPVVNGTYMSPYQSASRNILDAVVFDRLSRSYYASQTPSYAVNYRNVNKSVNNSYNSAYVPVNNYQDNVIWTDRSNNSNFQDNVTWSDRTPTNDNFQDNVTWSDRSNTGGFQDNVTW